jgi:archaellum component FlaF (FlaF/FlaG flagellin family)
MNKLITKNNGFTAVEGLLIVLILLVIGGIGYMVYHNDHKNKTVAESNTSKTSTTPKATSKANTTTQKYITISEWGVRVPYSGSDTLTIASQTCTENGDAAGDTVNLGCQVNVNSQDLANSVGSCQSTRATGTVGYFYRMGSNDNYSETDGSGFEPVAQWTAANPGQYTQIGSYTYAFAEIGAAWGGQGAVSINTSTNALADTVPTGCSNWVAEYNVVEPLVSPLASKFETIPN